MCFLKQTLSGVFTDFHMLLRERVGLGSLAKLTTFWETTGDLYATCFLAGGDGQDSFGVARNRPLLSRNRIENLRAKPWTTTYSKDLILKIEELASQIFGPGVLHNQITESSAGSSVNERSMMVMSLLKFISTSSCARSSNIQWHHNKIQ